MQDRFGYEETGDDWRAMLDGAGVNVFVNAAPNNLHRDPAVEAARRGIPVLCEKPLAHDADASYAMWRAADGAGIVHQAAFIHRFIPAIRYMRELIRGGTLGEPVHFRSCYLMSDYLRPDLPMAWRLDKAVAGTGTFGDLGSHHIDTARYLVGEIDEAMAWCEENGVDYIFGLAVNRALAALAHEVADDHKVRRVVLSRGGRRMRTDRRGGRGTAGQGTPAIFLHSERQRGRRLDLLHG